MKKEEVEMAEGIKVCDVVVTGVFVLFVFVYLFRWLYLCLALVRCRDMQVNHVVVVTVHCPLRRSAADDNINDNDDDGGAEEEGSRCDRHPQLLHVCAMLQLHSFAAVLCHRFLVVV